MDITERDTTTAFWLAVGRERERVVPDLPSQSLEDAKGFYRRVLGLEPIMDHGWIVTLAPPDRPDLQVSLMTHDETAPVVPNVSVQVDDVDAAFDAAVLEGAERSCTP